MSDPFKSDFVFGSFVILLPILATLIYSIIQEKRGK